MIYTSGIISDINTEETLEQLQDNKLAIVCEKIGLKVGEKLLDIGCGWGTLARFASVNYGAKATGITLGRNQTAWGNSALRKAGIPEEQSNILCMDYRDIPVPEGGYDKITCLEMAEHVGVRHFHSFLKQVYDMLDDDGVFYLQIAGLRKSWQYEDLIWGLFMNKYVFPGADASCPLGWFIDKLEGAGFEVKGTDTIGVHYSATLWRWYRNWMGNREKVESKYGSRWFRVSHPRHSLYCLVAAVLSTNARMCRSGNSSWPTQPSPRAKEPLLAIRLSWLRISTRRTESRGSPPSSISRERSSRPRLISRPGLSRTPLSSRALPPAKRGRWSDLDKREQSQNGFYIGALCRLGRERFVREFSKRLTPESSKWGMEAAILWSEARNNVASHGMNQLVESSRSPRWETMSVQSTNS